MLHKEERKINWELAYVHVWIHTHKHTPNWQQNKMHEWIIWHPHSICVKMAIQRWIHVESHFAKIWSNGHIHPSLPFGPCVKMSLHNGTCHLMLFVPCVITKRHITPQTEVFVEFYFWGTDAWMVPSNFYHLGRI